MDTKLTVKFKTYHGKEDPNGDELLSILLIFAGLTISFQCSSSLLSSIG